MDLTRCKFDNRNSVTKAGRVVTDGRHLSADGQPFRIKGVTYGSFLHRFDGEPFPERTQVKLDFRAMADLGLNVVRTYACPPPDVLDLAEECDLKMLIGLHYDDWRMVAVDRSAHRKVRDAGLRSVESALAIGASRASVLGYSIGNEVPGDLVRVHGIRGVERVLSNLAAAVHERDPAALVTYSNFPTTEYLEIDGLDFVSFNVFLERPEKLKPYLRHLQIVAGDRPLLVSELGLASEVHGCDGQAASLDWQLRLVDEAGCVGATVFSWTDEWGVGGEPVEGWGFGITTGDRTPKPAIETVRTWAGRDIADLRPSWPRISVIVCAYNESAVVAECLDSMKACRYPALEVLICDDGSTDTTREIARAYPFRLLELDHGGLSRARNAGIAAASGEIVAFIDADAYCHPDWLFHVAISLEDEGVMGTGGPNLPVEGVGFAERAIAYAPGGATHVLTADDRAEHVPGCNMAFRRDALLAVGGFDPAFTSAGDDVDVCWKVLDGGAQIGFAAAAQVRHHRRSTIRAYLRQQRNYGRSERMVAGRHRHRFNRLGQASWSGFIYGGQRLLPSLLRPVIYHGYQGHAPFQTVTSSRSHTAMGWASACLPAAVPLFLVGLLAAVVFPVVGLSIAALAALCVVGYCGVVHAGFRPDRHEPEPRRMRRTVTWLHVAQPIVRAWGRLRGRSLPALETSEVVWTGDRAAWLDALGRHLAAQNVSLRLLEPTHGWDLEIRSGPFLCMRLTTAVAWQWNPLHRNRLWPRAPLVVAAAAVVAIGLAGGPVIAAGAVTGAALIVEYLVLSRAVKRALVATTRGAGI